MKSIFVIIIFFVTGYHVGAQVQEVIAWSDTELLTWDDFKAKAPKNHEASAMSDINFTVEMHSEGNKLIIFIAPSFNPESSWGKKEDRNDYLLKHEQSHFDIYEVNARKLRSELKGEKISMSNAQSKVNKLLEKYNKLNVSVQNRYDLETEHSIIVEKQEKWNENIAKDLAKYSKFSSPTFEIPFERE